MPIIFCNALFSIGKEGFCTRFVITSIVSRACRNIQSRMRLQTQTVTKTRLFFVSTPKGSFIMKQYISAKRSGKLGLLILMVFGLFSFQSLADDSGNNAPMPIGLGIVEQLQFPNVDTDVMGLRLSLVYGRNANVSGLDFGVFGCGADGSLFGMQLSVILNSVGSANGALQISGIANNCLEDFYGIQLAGIANRTDGNAFGGQLAVFNIANELAGTQIGVYNQADKASGIQIGVINVANDMKGIQIGVFNIIKNGPLPYFLVFNADF